VTANVTDSGSGVGAVRYNISNASWSGAADMVQIAGTTFWTKAVDVSGLGDGMYSVTVLASDSVGNLNSTESVNATVDNSAPVVSNYAFNVSRDAVYGDVRIYQGEAIRFAVEVSDATNVSSVKATLNGANYTLSAVNGNHTNDTWHFVCTSTGQPGLRSLTHLYVNDTHGNAFANASVGLAFLIVNGSVNASLGSGTAIDASCNETLNLTFGFNKTVSGPSMLVYIPPNNASNYTQPPNYGNVSGYNCSFGTNCSLQAYYGGRSSPTRLNATGNGSGIALTLMSYLRAGTPAADTYDNWTVSYMAGSYACATRIRTPYLNISNVSCDGGQCVVDQNAAFTLAVTVDNNQTSEHTGTAKDVQVTVSSGMCANTSSLGNISSGGSNSTSWACNLTSAGNLSFTFSAWDATQAYNASRRTATVQSMDTEKPAVPTMAWTDDNVFNVNETVVYFVTVSDNVNVSAVWLTINKSGTAANHSMVMQTNNPQLAIWNVSYDSTDVLGNYTIPAVYASDTRNNLRAVTPSGIYGWFEVRNLTMNASLSGSSFSIGENVTVYANVSGNGSAISAVEAVVAKPGNANETVSLNLSAVAGGICQYSGTYSNVTKSGNYSVTVNATLASDISRISPDGFSVVHGNVSVQTDSDHLYLPKGIGRYNLTWFVVPGGGDLTGVNGTLDIANESVVNLTGTHAAARSFGDVSWQSYSSGYLAKWEINVTETLGTTGVTLNVNTTTPSSVPNAAKTITVEVIPTDTNAPSINALSHRWNVTNLLETDTISINATDNETAVDAVIVEMGWPSGGKQNLTAEKIAPNWYELAFSATNETGNFSYAVYVFDVSGNSAASSRRNFSVSGIYDVTLSPQYSAYNKGEDVYVTVAVRNVNNRTVSDFNVTMDLDKNLSANMSVLDNRMASQGHFELNASDRPATDDPVAYYVWANASKDGNAGAANTSFTVSKVIPTEFIYPNDGDYFAVGSGVNVSVSVENVRGDPMDNARSVLVRCTQCSRKYVELDWYAPTQTYVEFPSFDAPYEERFSVFAYASDYGRNDQGSNDVAILLTTTPPSSGSSGATGGGGGGAAGAGGGGGCSPKPEGPNYGNCGDGEDNDCDGATDCSDADCSKDPACLEIVKDFEFTLGTPRITIVQGSRGFVTGTLKNTGNVDLALRTSVEKDCCEVSVEGEIQVKPLASQVVTIEVRPRLSDPPGEYVISVKALAEGASPKEQAFTVNVIEHALVASLRGMESRVPELEKEIESYTEAGVDAGSLMQEIAKVKEHVGKALEAMAEDDLERFQSHVSAAQDSMRSIEATMLALRIQKFLVENKWGIVTAAVVSVFLSYLILEVSWPYYKLGREIKRLQHIQDSFVQARRETELQYFNRKIDEKTFVGIMKEKESQVMQARGQLKLRTQERSELVKKKLSLKAFAQWLRFVPSKIKEILSRKKGPALPPTSWER
jgi:hypothetical protein